MKKHLLIIIIFTATAFIPGFQQNAAADNDVYNEEKYYLNSGLNIMPGILFNKEWEPGYSGTAAYLNIMREGGTIFLGSGLEAGSNYSGLNLLVPIQAGMILSGNEVLQLSTSAALMPGIILSRPLPYFLFAAKINLNINWYLNDRFRINFFTGPLYSVSPVYSRTLAPLEMLVLDFELGTGFNLK